MHFNLFKERQEMQEVGWFGQALLHIKCTQKGFCFYHAIPCNTMLHNAITCNVIRCYAIPLPHIKCTQKAFCLSLIVPPSLSPVSAKMVWPIPGFIQTQRRFVCIWAELALTSCYSFRIFILASFWTNMRNAGDIKILSSKKEF